MSRLLKREKTQRLGWNGVEEIKGHPYFNGLNPRNIYFSEEVGLPVGFTRPDRPDSLFSLYALRERAVIKDYVKVFSFFCFYKIFRLKLFQDGLVQFCFPKEKRVWDSLVVVDIKKLNIEGPKSMQLVLADETLSLEVNLSVF